MRTKLTTLLTVLGAVTVLLLAGNTVALAAGGKGFLLGHTNKTAKTSTLQRTKPGPVLTLKAKTPASPPLKVNSSGLVAKLNADQLDGKHAADFATTAALQEALADLADARAQLDSTASTLTTTRAELDAAKAMTPIANGYVSSGGGVSGAQSTGVDSAVWNDSLKRYEITLTGVSYYFTDYATQVTPVCASATPSVGSVGGKLLVTLRDSGGNGIACPFAFDTTRLQ